MPALQEFQGFCPQIAEIPARREFQGFLSLLPNNSNTGVAE
jgi:hypothetical protein